MLVLSCSDDNDKPKSELEKLPPATQTGENTFGCLLDGKASLPGGGINPLDCVYQYVDGGYYFSLQCNKRDNFNNSINISLNTNDLEIEEGVTYILNESIPGNAYGLYYFNLYQSYTSGIYSGELIITNLTNTTVSGTFWFDVQHQNGVVHQIREGRFDMEYSN